MPAVLWSHDRAHMKYEHERVDEWVYKHDLENKRIDERVLPLSCGLCINHKYKFIFVRQLKGGSKWGRAPQYQKP